MAQSPELVTAVDHALAAVDVAASRPAAVAALVATATAAAPDDPEVASIVQRALGQRCWARGEMAAAKEHLRAAVAIADAAGLTVRSGEARGGLAYMLVMAGDNAGALAEIERAMPALDGIAGARLRVQQALVLDEIGRYAESVQASAQALAMLRRHGGDPLIEAALRNNRSIVLIRLREWQAAEEDLRLAEELYSRAGHPTRTASVHHNRALAAAARGDVPTALACFDEAAAIFTAAGRPLGLGPVEKAEVLLSVRLVAEARESAARAAIAFERDGNATDLAQARLVVAEAALLAGDAAAARAEAVAAQRAYTALHRPGWAALARFLVVRATWELGEFSDATLRTARRTATELDAAGWVVRAVDARLIAARIALALGRTRIARRELAGTTTARRTGPADARARAWHAEALLRLTDGDRRGAERALRSGIGVLERFRARLGATELRAHAAGAAGEIATLGARLAAADRRPVALLQWAERWRASALQLRSALPPDDPVLRDELAELRQVVADIGTAATTGQPTAALLRRQTRLEESVRARSRHARGPGARGADVLDHHVDGRLRGLLRGTAALVEYIALDGNLLAVVVGPDRTRMHDLGPVEVVGSALDGLLFGLRRIAHRASRHPRAHVVDVVARAAAQLDALLITPLDVPDLDLVVVPTGLLHAVPWVMLPSCARRPLSIAPSAALWSRACAAQPAGRGCVLVAGPRLPHAATEIAQLQQQYQAAATFTGEQARVTDVVAALDGTDVAHLAAHGHLRSDNPQFSALELADGPLTVYDLERLSAPPRLVVLSACDTGRPLVRPGDEQLGLASALLAMGTTALVAAVLPVDDAVTSTLMTGFHRELRGGLAPAAALAAARSALDPTAAGQTAAFQCYGFAGS